MPTSSRKKNIVICCDGTGNQFGDCNSNVVKLYTTMIVNNEQVGYYHPGVGTMGSPGERTKLGRKWSVTKGMAFGAGFRDNVLDAYRYLMEQYNDGDQIYLFGFSRGAYTARALAGMLNAYGLLCRGNEGQIPYVWRMFAEQLSNARQKNETTIEVADAFKETFSHPNLRIRFVGLWDTVSSIGWIYEPLQLLYMAQNPVIECGRHAVSIDERRCFFRDNLWGDALPDQDILQVWFAGVHSDVGGSYPQTQSALSNIALEWMLDEAQKAGLQINEDRRKMIFAEGTEEHYAAADLYGSTDPLWPIHRSLRGSWWLVEFLPHRFYDKDQGQEQWRIPLGHPRELPDASVIHPAVAERIRDPRFAYAPKNLPAEALAVHPGRQAGTSAELGGYYLYQPTNGPAAKTAGSGKVAAVAAAAAVLACAAVMAKKLLG